MSTEPEKRSDEETWAELAEAATAGPWTIEEATEAKRFYMDTMPLTADVAAADEPVAYGGPAEDGGPHVGACRLPDAAFIAAAREAVPALLAALAASRADNERLTDEMDDLRDEAERLRASRDKRRDITVRALRERDAARVEVSQLRAKIERVEALIPGIEVSGLHGLLRDLRAALAEPLGSTPDQPATEETTEKRAGDEVHEAVLVRSGSSALGPVLVCSICGRWESNGIHS